MEKIDDSWVSCSEMGAQESLARVLCTVPRHAIRYCTGKQKFCTTSCEFCKNNCPCTREDPGEMYISR